MRFALCCSALVAVTVVAQGPAWASFEEREKGTITPGLLDDVTVFDTHLVEAGRSAPARLLGAKVLYTIVGGRVVYQR